MPANDIPTTPAPLLTARQTAEALAISPRKLWSLTAGGALKCVRIGRSVRYDRRDLIAFIDQQKREGNGHA